MNIAASVAGETFTWIGYPIIHDIKWKKGEKLIQKR